MKNTKNIFENTKKGILVLQYDYSKLQLKQTRIIQQQQGTSKFKLHGHRYRFIFDAFQVSWEIQVQLVFKDVKDVFFSYSKRNLVA